VSATTSKKGTFTLVTYTSTVESTAALAAIRKVIPKAAFSHSTINRNSTTLKANIPPTKNEPAACATAESPQAEPQQSQTLDTAAFIIDSSSSDEESYSTPDEDESKPPTTEDHKRHYQTFVCTTLVLTSVQLESFSDYTCHAYYGTGTGICVHDDDTNLISDQLKQLTQHHPIVGFPALDPHNPSSKRLQTLIEGILPEDLEQAVLITSRLYETDRASARLNLANFPNTSARSEPATTPAVSKNDPPEAVLRVYSSDGSGFYRAALLGLVISISTLSGDQGISRNKAFETLWLMLTGLSQQHAVIDDLRQQQLSDPGSLVDYLITTCHDEHIIGSLRLATATFLSNYSLIPYKDMPVTSVGFVCAESWFNPTTTDTSLALPTQYASMEALVNEILQPDTEPTPPVIVTICQILKINLTLTLPSATLAEALGFYASKVEGNTARFGAHKLGHSVLLEYSGDHYYISFNAPRTLG
jgi:hypothetical protein